MIIGHYLFANNGSKCCIKSLYQIKIVVLSKTICRALNININLIWKNLQNCVQFERFFISYNNIDFYENVYDQQFHNYARLLLYTTRYICFMKAFDGSPLLYLSNDDIDYSIVNNLLSNKTLLSPSNMQYQSKTMRCI